MQFTATRLRPRRPCPAEFYDATPPRKLMATYDADHDLLPPEVAADRVAWLAKELGLK